MNAKPPDVLERWWSQVESLRVSVVCSRSEDADANMLLFPVAEAQRNEVTPEQLDELLERAYRHFSRTLSSSNTNLWFYAWHDEVSGTLRMSLCRAEGATELPFACRLNVVSVPRPVSTEALRSAYVHGIPHAELEPIDEGDDEEADDFVLTVFARPLIRQV